jgi:uncharacterized secreted repeat protein (TIGR03808 family)
MPLDRRLVLGLGFGVGAALAATTTGSREAEAGPRSPERGRRASSGRASPSAPPSGAGTAPRSEDLQRLIDRAAATGEPLHLPAGRFLTGPLTLHAGTRIRGAGRRTVLAFTGGSHFIRAERAAEIALLDLTLEGGHHPVDTRIATASIDFSNCGDLELRGLHITGSLLGGIRLRACSGRIADCRITQCGSAAIQSLDATGLEIAHNHISDCGNNGIQVWRGKAGDDGTIVTANRIERIASRAGGNGQNGNGINIFRAGGVLVSGNRITDCAYSAVRANAASNVQILANNCARLGEVALYAEFGFEGAVIAQNVVDGAASGIAVTNFDHGGRLAVVQGNLIRSLHRREHEPEDKRGDGITVEADAVVSGNVVEGAPTAGIVVGWGRYRRDVSVTGNLVRAARIGILVSGDPQGGHASITGNMISGATAGAIRAHDHGKPSGPDLAAPSARSATLAHLSLRDNVAT